MRNFPNIYVCFSFLDFAYLDITQPGIAITPVSVPYKEVLSNGSVGTLNIDLKLRANVLDGNNYKFKLTVINIDDTVEATVEVKINTPPAKGELHGESLCGKMIVFYYLRVQTKFMTIFQ